VKGPSSSPNSARTSASTRGANPRGSCSPARSTAPDARRTRWPRSGAPARCSRAARARPGARPRAPGDRDPQQVGGPRTGTVDNRAAQPGGRVWPRLGPRTTVDLARTLALVGGDALVHSRRDRLAAALAAERTGDVALTARVIGAYDVPALWSRADDPEQSRAVVTAAERTLSALGPGGPGDLRARLLATIAVESRSGDTSGTALKTAREAAHEAEALARETWAIPRCWPSRSTACSCSRSPAPGSRRRGTRSVPNSRAGQAHGLPTFAILGLLIRMQSASALGDIETAAEHADAAEQLAADPRVAGRPRPHGLVPGPSHRGPKHRAGRTEPRVGGSRVPRGRRRPEDGRNAGRAPRPAPARAARPAPAARPPRPHGSAVGLGSEPAVDGAARAPRRGSARRRQGRPRR
jgi:hypothetical protein